MTALAWADKPRRSHNLASSHAASIGSSASFGGPSNTRVRIAMHAAQATRLWQLLSTRQTEEEKQHAEGARDF
jgi:hypothetical protein